MTTLNLPALRYVLLPAEGPSPLCFAWHEQAFRLWHSIWSETLRDLDGLKNLYSDDFTRQSSIACLFHEQTCVALGFFRSVDFRSASSRLDSYFRIWSDESIEKMVLEGPSVRIASNFVIHPDHRGEIFSRIGLKEILVCCMVKSFVCSQDDVMVGTTRRDKGMDRAARYFGAEMLVSGIEFHGVTVDLVAFYRRRMTPRKVDMIEIERVWNARIDYTQGSQRAPMHPIPKIETIPETEKSA